MAHDKSRRLYKPRTKVKKRRVIPHCVRSPGTPRRSGDAASTSSAGIPLILCQFCPSARAHDATVHLGRPLRGDIKRVPRHVHQRPTEYVAVPLSIVRRVSCHETQVRKIW